MWTEEVVDVDGRSCGCGHPIVAAAVWLPDVVTIQLALAQGKGTGYSRADAGVEGEVPC